MNDHELTDSAFPSGAVHRYKASSAAVNPAIFAGSGNRHRVESENRRDRHGQAARQGRDRHARALGRVRQQKKIHR